MNSSLSSSARALLRRSTPPASAFFLLAGLVASVGTAIVLLTYVSLAWMTNPDFQFDRLLFVRCAVWGLLWFILLFGGTIVWNHRPTQDRVFTVVGLGATFFGLAAVALFFLQLFGQIADWASITPKMVAENNEFLQRRVDETASRRKAEEASMRREMDAEIRRAKTDAEKAKIRAEFEKDIIPDALKGLEKTEAEYKTALEVGYRPRTDAASNFWHFVSHGPSSEPQNAGIFSALVGSLWMGLISLVVAVPLGVGAAIYLEEYRRGGAPVMKSIQNVIQVNINNLAGVPSVVYGIFGGAVIVDYVFHPIEQNHPWIAARNTLGGGLTLALLTLPVIIVASQEAIRAVPDSIRQGAYALGATRWQTIWRQVLPMATPGILTGCILGICRAIGEAAPLVLFGALLFVDQVPSLFSRFTVMPMQIFGWSDRPGVIMPDGSVAPIWQANAALASVVLMGALLTINALAIYFRNRARRKMKV